MTDQYKRFNTGSLILREIYTPYYEKNTNNLIIIGGNIMTVSTIAAGIVIVGLSALLELNARAYENEKKAFESEE